MIEQSKILDTGVTATYWVITEVGHSLSEKKTFLKLCGYISEKAFKEGKKEAGTAQVDLDLDSQDIDKFYAKVKELKKLE